MSGFSQLGHEGQLSCCFDMLDMMSVSNTPELNEINVAKREPPLLNGLPSTSVSTGE